MGGHIMKKYMGLFAKDMREITGVFTPKEHNEIVRALNENHDPAIDRIDRTEDGNVEITFRYIPSSIKQCKGIKAYISKW